MACWFWLNTSGTMKSFLSSLEQNGRRTTSFWCRRGLPVSQGWQWCWQTGVLHRHSHREPWPGVFRAARWLKIDSFFFSVFDVFDEDGSMDHNGNEEPLFLMRVQMVMVPIGLYHKGVDDFVRSMDQTSRGLVQNWQGFPYSTWALRRVDVCEGKIHRVPQRIAKLVYS